MGGAMSDTVTVRIGSNGKVTYIDPRAADLIAGPRTQRRASHVVPARQGLRVAFRLLRWIFGEDGRVARWTRTWGCWWAVQIGDGHPVGAWRSREAAIEYEIRVVGRML